MESEEQFVEDDDSLHFLKTPGLVSFDQFLTAMKRLPSKGEGDQSVVYYLKVVDKHCNALGNMHGGCIATLLDDVTSFSLRDGSTSVSVDLSVSYLRAIPNNSEIHVSGTLVRKGRSLAFMTGKITCAKRPSLVYASCAHTKYIMGPSRL